MAAIGEAPTLFLRKATGLVKGWSKFDAFLYSFMSVNFVTLGLFFALSATAVARVLGADRRQGFLSFAQAACWCVSAGWSGPGSRHFPVKI